MSERRRYRRGKLAAAKLERFAALDPTDTEERQRAACAQALGLPSVPDVTGWARVLIEHYRISWMKTGDPLYVWKALKVCRQVSNEVPLWIDDYFRQVTVKITDPNILRGDIGRILPRILGFHRQPGKRSKPPEPINDFMQIRLAIGFARAILEGAEPADALARAREDVNEELATKDDRTLLTYMRQSFSVKGAPRTHAQWRSAIGAWLKHFHRLERTVKQAIRA